MGPYVFTLCDYVVDFPGGSDGKASTYNVGDPWVGKTPWRRKWQPAPVLLPGKSPGWRSMVGYNPWGHKELDTTERLHIYFMWLCFCFPICKLAYTLEVLNRKAEQQQKGGDFSPSVSFWTWAVLATEQQPLPGWLPWWQAMSRSILFFPALFFTALHAGWLRNEYIATKLRYTC